MSNEEQNGNFAKPMLADVADARDIKFRAWDETQKYMAYQGTSDLENIQSFMFHFGDKKLMQFTGHKDIEGKEIFEGDILGDWNDCDGEMVESNETVYFDEALGCWMLDHSVNQDQTFSSSLFDNLNDFLYKVVGNIYECKVYDSNVC